LLITKIILRNTVSKTSKFSYGLYLGRVTNTVEYAKSEAEWETNRAQTIQKVL